MTSRRGDKRCFLLHHWLSIAALCMFVALGSDSASAQTKVKTGAKTDAPCADSTTTRTGVYTARQAMRGADVYAGNCRSCHTPETHTGATFNAVWNKRPLIDLYTYIRERMPKNEPGSLSSEEYADVLAYVLKMNRMPPGQTELLSDAAHLKSIRIELAKSP